MRARRLTLGVVTCLVATACLLSVVSGSALAKNGTYRFGPVGHEAGQLAGAKGMAIDGNGNFYISEEYNERVSKFDSAGNFSLAWGWKVNQESPAEELQTCTLATGCNKGDSGSGAGKFASQSGATGVAIDNDPLSSSYNDIYVIDWGNFRVEKFEPQEVAGKVVMKFVLTFGGHVNETNSANVCLAGEACTRGAQGTGNGEFDWAYEHVYIAVGANEHVYVGDRARVEVFEPTGVWKENISLSKLTTTGKVTALAVNTSGDVYVKVEGVPGVRELEPNGTEMVTKLDEQAGESIESITLDASGDVYVSENNHHDFLEYSPTGQELESFGGKTLVSMTSALAFDNAKQELYVAGTDQFSNEEYGHFGIWAFPVPGPGPMISSGSEMSTPETRGAASFEAEVTPEGNSTNVHIEYVDQAQFESSGYANATSTASQPIGVGFGEAHVEVHLPAKTLIPGTTYHWRLVAADSVGHTSTGASEILEETPAALIDGPSVSDVAGTSATLSARIDPLGAKTSYRLEYGLGGAYEHAFSGNAGEGRSFVSLSYHVQELQADTPYDYRLVTESESGTLEVVHTFTTQRLAEAIALPDGRAWELVSPANKKAALIGPSDGYFLTQAADDGNGITYTVPSEPLGEGTVGHIFASQILSTRGAGGWSTRDVSGYAGMPLEGSAKALFGGNQDWPIFSSNLSVGLMEPGSGATPQSSDAGERTLYLRDNNNGSFTPIENEADVQHGVRFGDEAMIYITGTPDLSYVVLDTSKALTPEAGEIPECAKSLCEAAMNVYEWHAGRLQLVNIFPDGTTKPGAHGGNENISVANPEMVAHAISNDGRWIVWKYGGLNQTGKRTVYVRDMVGKHTFQIGRAGAFARFETMTPDGSKIFFVETQQGFNGDLYVFDTKTDTQTDLTANHGAHELSAGVQNAVLGTSEDGTYVYFVATGVLAPGGVSGADNLYVLHEGSNGWTTTHIATLTEEDEHTWGGGNGHSEQGYRAKAWQPVIDSEVSANGRYVAFMSNSQLTRYDNVDAVSGARDEEVYLYDDTTNRLVCASCNPTGARPVGVFDTGNANNEWLLADNQWAWGEHASGSDHTLAGSLVGWNDQLDIASYHPRFLFNDGRLFFDSPDALVPQDTNGLEDVYEFEPVKGSQSTPSDNCTTAWPTYSERSGGCVSLISSGQSATESVFMDASATGDDVFFAASDKLVPEDYDTAYDMYDAHVCADSEPCRSSPVSPPECTSGDSCKAAPSPQPDIFGPTPSATFNGKGNVVEVPTKAVAPRSLTKAQKLARALKACRKSRTKRKRATCEQQVRKRFHATRSRKATATKKGNR